jgi:dTDP-4-dehydrorhamnose 3,5-epimerase
MLFADAGLPGAYVIEIEPVVDERGFFARTFCQKELATAGLETKMVQSSLSYNKQKGTLRGMHYQAEPNAEVKIVRCIRGMVFDVIVDLRPTSPSYCRWTGVELSAENHRALYIPKGFAHGFLTLSDDTELEYHISTSYIADSARGVRWNDPAFGIKWPDAPRVMSSRDQDFPDYVS